MFYDGIEDIIAMRTVLTPAGPIGIRFRTVEETGLVVIEPTARAAPGRTGAAPRCHAA